MSQIILKKVPFNSLFCNRQTPVIEGSYIHQVGESNIEQAAQSYAELTLSF